MGEVHLDRPNFDEFICSGELLQFGIREDQSKRIRTSIHVSPHRRLRRRALITPDRDRNVLEVIPSLRFPEIRLSEFLILEHSGILKTPSVRLAQLYMQKTNSRQDDIEGIANSLRSRDAHERV